MNLLELHARRKLGMPDEWVISALESMPHDRDEALYYLVTGVVAPLRQDGADHDWRRADESTRRSVSITPAEQAAFEVEWERETGNCANCVGDGKILSSWSVASGTQYRPCGKCGGNGKVIDSAPKP